MRSLNDILGFDYKTLVSTEPTFHIPNRCCFGWINTKPIANIFDEVVIDVWKETESIVLELHASEKMRPDTEEVKHLINQLISNYGKDSYGTNWLPKSSSQFGYLWNFIDERYKVSDDTSEESVFLSSIRFDYFYNKFFFEIENYKFFHENAYIELLPLISRAYSEEGFR